MNEYEKNASFSASELPEWKATISSKKSLQIRNRTNYFNPSTTRTWNSVSNPNTYRSRRIKIEGYENRLYWEYRYCEDHSGDTYFYTLTYNDNAMPKYEIESFVSGDVSFNCFNYDDLVYLLNGGFKKQLLRKYGTNFKYFVGAELGDGKGERGMHNNPHYHVLFFLRDANHPRYPYRRISPEDFRHLVKTYWQGFDEYTDGKKDYREAKYGIAKEGDNLGRVIDFRACMYCAKYVCKDVNLKIREQAVLNALTKKYTELCDPLYEECYIGFFNDVLVGKFQITGLEPSYLNVSHYIETFHLEEDYFRYIDLLVQSKVREAFNEYRNKYCNKCRVSQGLGDYALNFISDPLDPHILVPSKKGFKQRPLNMYYYRKLYTEVVKDPNGQPLRILNELGIRYKMACLPRQIEKLKQTTTAQVATLTRDLFNKMVASDINTNVKMTYDDFLQSFSMQDLKIKEKIIDYYAKYKLIYEDRFCQFDLDTDTGECNFPSLNVMDDYYRFLRPAYFEVDYRPGRLNRFVSNVPLGYISYNQHPDFVRYIGVFRCFDLLCDYLFIQTDNRNQQLAEENAQIKRFHNQKKVKEFYDFFN